MLGDAATGAGDSLMPRKGSLVTTVCVWTKVVCSSLLLFICRLLMCNFELVLVILLPFIIYYHYIANPAP